MLHLWKHVETLWLATLCHLLELHCYYFAIIIVWLW